MPCRVVDTLCLLLLPLGLALPLYSQAQSPATPTAHKPNTLNIGQVRITNYRSVKGSLKSLNSHFIGPGVTIDAPEKGGGHIHLVADDVVIPQTKAGGFAAELSGNVRYQLIRSGQSVDGRAGRASYRRDAGRVELSDGVEATFTDPAQFTGPATLRSGSVLINTGTNPFRYELNGANNEIQFTPRGKNGANSGPVRLSGFRNGTFAPGTSAILRGPQSTLTLTDPTTKAASRIEGNELAASFAKELQRAEATGNVRYHVEQTAKSGTLETVTGTGERVSYVPADNQLIITGDVSADIITPNSLQGPGHLHTDRAVITTRPSTQVELTGDASSNKIVFTPKPATDSNTDTTGAKPKRFGFGTVQLTHFTSGVFEPGSAIHVKGAETLFQTKDAATRSASTVQAREVTTRFNADRSITAATITGPVTFRFEEPSTATTLQGIHGTAQSAEYKNGADGQEMHLHGPLDVRVTDPEHLAQPAVASGKQGDEFVLYLGTGEFAFNTDRQTGSLSFDLRDQSETNPSKTKPSKGGKPNVKPKKPAAKPGSKPGAPANPNASGSNPA